MKQWLRNNRGFLLFLLMFGTFRGAIADWNPVPSGSMRPTILEGDVVFVNRIAFDLKLPLTHIGLARLGEPDRGDIVTFDSPRDGTRLIKRVIALPGDTVAMRAGILSINGRRAEYTEIESVVETLPADGRRAAVPVKAVRADEYAGPAGQRIQMLPEVSAIRDYGPVTVPPGHYLMLGDNRDNSIDSRYFGVVARHLLVGRAERILVSADIRENWLPRWERFGMRLGNVRR